MSPVVPSDVSRGGCICSWAPGTEHPEQSSSRAFLGLAPALFSSFSAGAPRSTSQQIGVNFQEGTLQMALPSAWAFSSPSDSLVLTPQLQLESLQSLSFSLSRPPSPKRNYRPTRGRAFTQSCDNSRAFSPDSIPVFFSAPDSFPPGASVHLLI